ncbi:conserved hypothetical protein [Ricinus communis]|uniref:Uncharacterized protein n=1 Tax=Ricinus communis TaxID=3988 RepID=B9RSH4_RICCO|nr:conserved hypothetical protein [Ricinus communis]
MKEYTKASRAAEPEAIHSDMAIIKNHIENLMAIMQQKAELPQALTAECQAATVAPTPTTILPDNGTTIGLMVWEQLPNTQLYLILDKH